MDQCIVRSCTRPPAWLMFISVLVFSLTDLIAPFRLCCFPYTEDALDLNIWWSVPQFAPHIVRVLQMLILSRHLVMMKSIIFLCRERGMRPCGLVMCILLFEHGVGDCLRVPARNFLMMNPLQYKLYYWIIIRGISHGFDGIQDQLVMARHFKDIL